jgi:membrane dipeptidase
VLLQVCPIFVDLDWMPELALRRALRQALAFDRAVRDNGDRVAAVRTSGDLERLTTSSKLGLMLAIEGAEPLGNDPELLDVFQRLGVRVISLTWNRRNAFADGVGENTTSGLSRLGRELVDRIIEQGLIVDLAHASEHTFWEVLDRVNGAPVVVTHAACRGLYDTTRNLSDEQLRALSSHGGVLGLMQLPMVIDPDHGEIERVVDHIDHAVDVMGIDHVGLGGDFIAQLRTNVPMRIPPDSFHPKGAPPTSSIANLEGPQDYPNLAQALRRRGYEGERLAAVLGANFLRFFSESLPSDDGRYE